MFVRDFCPFRGRSLGAAILHRGLAGNCGDPELFVTGPRSQNGCHVIIKNERGRIEFELPSTPTPREQLEEELAILSPFKHEYIKCQGGFPGHPAPAPHGLFVLRLDGYWELQCSTGRLAGYLELGLFITGRDRNGCHIIIRDERGRIEFELPSTPEERLRQELRTFPAYRRSPYERFLGDVARKFLAAHPDFLAPAADPGSADAHEGLRVSSGQPDRQTGTAGGLLDDLLLQLDALTGLASVKTEVMKLIAMVRVGQMRQAEGFPVTQVSRHLVFTGNPGTGKTTVARLLGRLYAAIGILPTGQLVEVTRSDLVAGYVGQTAIKTTEVVNRAVGGILFIDEACALTRDVDFGQEAVDTLVKLMEDHRDELVVIVAGYGEEMAQFIHANPGLPSRFSQTIQFPDYSTDELITIFKGMCDHDRYQVSNAALDDLRHYLETLPRTREFGNARLVRNLFEAAIGRQASRIVASGSSDLITLTPADLGLPD
jgi:hypothetical protein